MRNRDVLRRLVARPKMVRIAVAAGNTDQRAARSVKERRVLPRVTGGLAETDQRDSARHGQRRDKKLCRLEARLQTRGRTVARTCFACYN